MYKMKLDNVIKYADTVFLRDKLIKQGYAEVMERKKEEQQKPKKTKGETNA